MRLLNRNHIRRQNFSWYLIAILPGCWSIFGSRWGSYLPREPFFFNDLFISILVLSFVLSREKVIRKRKFTSFLIFFLYLVIKILFSSWDNVLLVLRDSIPYIYLVTAPLIAIRILTANARIVRQLGKFMEWCIVGHAAWTIFSYYFPGLIKGLPVVSNSQELHIFSIRADFDAAIMSVLIAMVIMGQISVIPIRLKIPLALLGSSYILLQGNRASFISFSILIFISLKYRLKKIKVFYAKAVATLIIVLLVSLGIVGISQLAIGERFVGATRGFSQGATEIAGSGTASARISAWNQVAQYVNSSPARIGFGIGFGTDYMQQSGALRALVNADQGSRTLPRQPHNYWLNTYARIGLLGMGILLILLTQTLKIVAKVLREPTRYGVETLMSSLIFAALIPVATFGVVLESPFGALSLAMAIAFMLAEREKAVQR